MAAPRIRLRRERQRKAVFSPAMESEMLSLAEQPLRDIAMIVFDAGMRPDEIVRLQWANVLWDKSLIFVEKGKTNKATRYVPLSDRVKAALRVRLQGSTSQWVFPSKRKKGSHISYFGPAKQFGELRGLVGIPKDLVLYSARHTFGTDLLERTGNIKLVQEAMGHESVTTTQRYLHPDKSEMAGHINDRNRDRARRAENSGHTFGHTDKTVQ